MFATLKNGPNQAPLVAIQESNGLPVQGQGHQHQACNHCREKKLKCTALKTGCDRCVSEGIVCKLPEKRRDSRTHQKAGVGKAAARRNEANRASMPNKNMASQALTHKYTSSQTSNGNRTPETVTPALTSGTSSASSNTTGIPTPLPSAHSDNGSNGMWQMPSLESGNATMTLGLSGSDFNLQSLKSPPGLEDFFVDPEFDAFGLEQDDDMFFDNMDLDFVNKDDFEMPRVGRSPALDGGESRSIASPLVGRQDSRVHRVPSAPPQSPWSDVHRSASTSVPSKASTKEAKNDVNSRPMQCDCLGVTLSLLEKVYFRDVRASVSNWIGLLHDFKQWMRSFQGVTDCTACSCATDSLMLLVVVCEKLGDSFGIISTIYEKLAEALSEKSGSRTPEMCMLGGKYSVDSVEEFACLFKYLALRHLQYLYRAIISLDNKAVQKELTTHHESLQRQTDRLRLMKSALNQAHLKETETETEGKMVRMRQS